MQKQIKHSAFIDLCISLSLTALFTYLYINIPNLVIQTLPSTVSPDFFPKKITVIIIAMGSTLACIYAISLYNIHYGNKKINYINTEINTEDDKKTNIVSLLLYICTLFLYLIGLYYIGFVYSTPIVMLIISILLGVKRYIIGIIFYISFTLALNYLSLHIMQIILPTGILFN